MPPTIATDAPPLRVDETGTIRIGSSRITLDVLIEAYRGGETPESFAQGHTTVSLAEVYAAIAYYLLHRADLDPYLAQREQQAQELREQIESQPGYQDTKQSLLQRARDRGLLP